jgi:hypothetical protein
LGTKTYVTAEEISRNTRISQVWVARNLPACLREMFPHRNDVITEEGYHLASVKKWLKNARIGYMQPLARHYGFTTGQIAGLKRRNVFGAKEMVIPTVSGRLLMREDDVVFLAAKQRSRFKNGKNGLGEPPGRHPKPPVIRWGLVPSTKRDLRPKEVPYEPPEGPSEPEEYKPPSVEVAVATELQETIDKLGKPKRISIDLPYGVKVTCEFDTDA